MSVEAEKNNDENLFEEIPRLKKEALENNEQAGDKTTNSLNEDIDDNFMLKYKAKMNKQYQKDSEIDTATAAPIEKELNTPSENIVKNKTLKEEGKSEDSANNIEKLSGGNIVEKPAVNEQLKYNESLDYLDNNVKYSKYVIYIDPENTDFIESLTVKERKNLINRILKEQDDIAITKKRLNLMQTLIKHSIVAIITIAIAIPVIYTTINASLEASINNYRRSQGLFQTLYKQHGKIKSNKY